MEQQVLAHHSALVVQTGYAQGGDDPNLRQAATEAVPLIRHHLDDAERLIQATRPRIPSG
jgi:putative membrane protein